MKYMYNPRPNNIKKPPPPIVVEEVRPEWQAITLCLAAIGVVGCVIVFLKLISSWMIGG